MRQGREFEKLVATIEKALDKTGAVIESPARIPDLDSGVLREVDISIRINTGSTNLLIIVECRDRSRSSDVIWIEELVTKRVSIGADKVIAVSSKAWTKGALKKAKKYSIETRTLEKIYPNLVKSWIAQPTARASSILYECLSSSFTGYKQNDDPDELANARIAWLDEKGKPNSILKNVKANQKLNFINLFHLICDEQKITFKHDNNGYFGEAVHIERLFDDRVLSVTTSLGEYFIRHVDMTLRVSGHSSDLKLATISNYSNDKTPLAKLFSFSGNLDVQGKIEEVELTALFEEKR